MLGDFEWEDKENDYVLKSTVCFSNRSEKNIYYLREDLSEQLFLLESLDSMSAAWQMFSGTRPPARSEFWSNSLICSALGDEFKVAIKWECWPISDELGLRFCIDDYLVYAGTDVRVSYVLQSAIDVALIQVSGDSYVDMWALADNPKNSFQTDSRSEWVTLTFPDKEPGAMKNQGK